MKILLIGDSISKGLVYSEDRHRYCITPEGFVPLLQKQFKASVDSLARVGSTLRQGVKQLFESDKLETSEIVAIEFGGNDCDFKWDEVKESPFAPHLPKMHLPEFLATLNNTLNKLKKQGHTPVLFTLPPVDGDRYLRWISKSNQRDYNNILKFLGTSQTIHDWQRMYSQAIGIMAKEFKAHCVDLRKAFEAQDWKQLLCRDGIHPNEGGHALIAREIMSYIHMNHLEPSLL